MAYKISWPGTIPAGQVYEHPVSALDVAATAAAIAKAKTNTGDLDGVNLIPHLAGEVDEPPHDALMWRWVAQSAIRAGKWKLLRGGDREYLYDLDADLEEKHNLASQYPEVATRLREQLSGWAATLDPPGLAGWWRLANAGDCAGTRPILARHELPVFPLCRHFLSKFRVSLVDIRSRESGLTST